MPIKCNAEWERRFQRVTRKKKESYSADEAKDIKQRIQRLKSLVNKNKGLSSSDNRSMARFFYDSKFSQELGKITQITDDFKWNSVDTFFANRLGEYKKWFGLHPDELTDTGKVRRDILTMKRVGGGMIDEFARYQGMQQVKKVTNEITNTLKSVGVTNKNLVNELIVEAIEVGSFPRLKTFLDVHQHGQVVLKQQYQDFLDELSSLGLSQDQINKILDESYKIFSIMDETRIIANSLGLQIGSIDGIGYFSRNFTKDASKWIDKANELNGFFPRDFEPKGFQVANGHAKGRSTFKYIPEDDAVVAYQLGIDVEDLKSLVNDGLLQEYIHAKTDPALLDNMVDMGTLSKIPMTTKEVHNYIVSQYKDLPYKGLADTFIIDPKQAYDDYVNQLKKGVEESILARGIVREGVEAGWAIPKSQFRAIADTSSVYDDFVELTTKEIKEFYPDYGGGGVYTHKVVKDSINAILQTSGNPAFLGTLGQHAMYWGKFLTKSVLIRPAYAMRILYDTFIASSAAGNNMLRMMESGTDLMRLSVVGLDALDNTKKVYKSLDGKKNITERHLFQEYIKHKGSGFVPTASNIRVGTPFENWRNFDPKRSAGYFAQYIKTFGVTEGSKLAGEAISRVQDELFTPIATVAAFFENMGKWSTVKSLADTRKGVNEVGQFISGLGTSPKDYNNLKDIFNHVDDYFYAWDDVGTFTTFTGSLLRPFATFAMKNPPAQIRQLLRNPRQFVNYWRIRSFINQRTEQDEQLIDASVQDWVQKGAPIFLDKDSESGHWYTLLTSNFDARAEAFRWFESLEDGIQRMLGNEYVGTAHDKISYQEDKLSGKNGVTSFFNEQARMLLPVWKESISLLSGTDVDTGYKLERSPLKASRTFLGLNMSPAAKWVLSIYPPIENIDRSNPGGIFGTPEIRDPITNEIIVEGNPSIFGNKKVSIRLEQYSPEVQTGMLSILNILGLSVKVVDVARNTQHTFTQMDNLASKMESELKAARKELSAEIASGDSKKYSKDFKRRKKEYHETLRKWAHLRAETILLGEWMHKNNIPTSEVWEKLDQEAVKSIPDLITDEDTFNTIMNEVLTDYGELHLNE